MRHVRFGLATLAVAMLNSAPGYAAEPAEEKEAWVRVVEERQGYEPPETGGDWVRVARDEGGSIYFIDKSSIRQKGRFLTAWEKQDHRAAAAVGSRERWRCIFTIATPAPPR